MFLFLLQISFAAPAVTASSQESANALIHSADDTTPFGRLQIALAAVEKESDSNTLLTLGNTHPHIAIMTLEESQLNALQYLLAIPSTEKHKLIRGDGIIRNAAEMSKDEKKKALIVAKYLEVPKKFNAIRVDSFDGITIEFEFAYKEAGEMKRKTLQMAHPYAPVIARESQTQLKTLLGVRPQLPTEGEYSILPLSSPSFDEGLRAWTKTVGFSFEVSEPAGVISVDADVAMDGKSSLRFYNTEKTRSFDQMSQSFPLKDQIQIRVQCFVTSKKSQVEYRQDASLTQMRLDFKDSAGQVLQTEVKPIRLGTYDWERLTIDAYVPQNAESAEISLMSSVSGKIWVDGVSVVQLQ